MPFELEKLNNYNLGKSFNDRHYFVEILSLVSSAGRSMVPLLFFDVIKMQIF